MIEIKLQKRLRSSEGEINLEVDKQIESGEFVTLFGKSGAGKTTILRILAGLLEPDSGKIVIEGECWLDTQARFSLSPQKRRVGFVFQNYALFPHMSVERNLLYALENKRDRHRVEEILEVMELGNLRQELPETLSGGQKQRVALARALVREPKLLLLDEPLSALDHSMRLKLQEELLRIQRHFGVTTLLVSHDLGEVFRLSTRVLEIVRGSIVRDGAPSEVFGGKQLSGKFRFSGEVLGIEKSDILYTLTILVGNEMVKVAVSEEEASELSDGCSVVIASKAFNPLVIKAGATPADKP